VVESLRQLAGAQRGWRIDYVLVSAQLRASVKTAKIHADVMGSDHCPVSITLDGSASAE
jgi:exodeoxyribonuclease-3